MSGPNDAERIAALAARLGLAPGSLRPDLALQALRHGSYVHERSLSPAREQLKSNERLEFLGDSVLGFCVARWVHDHFAEAGEGELTRLRASLVREESLAVVARALSLGDLLLLGRGEERSGGRENAGRLADALEAVIAAVFVSCGLGQTQEVLERLFAPLFAQVESLVRDPKTELQQLLQSRRRSAQYAVLAITGPAHALWHEVEVRLDAIALATGSGRTKKEAEQEAARRALDQSALLERALLEEPFALAQPDPRWPALFAEEAARVRGELGEDLVALEHAGSTAVPGLAGRAAVDLLAGVRMLVPSLRLPEYESCGEAGLPGRLYLRRRGASSFDLHVVEHQGPRWLEALRLRDLLRASPAEAARYQEEKARAAAGSASLFDYAQAKARLFEGLLARAAG